MYPKYFRLMCAMTAVLLAIIACNINVPGGAATSTPGPTTEIGKDVPTATDTPLATETESPASTDTLEPTETEPAITSTPIPPIASVSKEANCRIGPSGAYELVVALKPGDKVDVIARDLGAGFVFVKPANLPEGVEGCWVLYGSLDVSGDVTPLPAFTPLPSPTLPPSFTIKFKNMDKCETGRASAFTRFIIVNTGNIQFRSAYIKVTSQRTGESTEQSVNAFDLTTGCIIAQNIAPLKPGGTGYLQSAPFIKNPTGQKMHAIIQVCSEQFMKGACVTNTLDFTAK